MAGVRPEAAAQTRVNAFARVQQIGLTLPDVTAATGYDGSPRLHIGGCFMAGLATHPSAEPESLVVRATSDERELLVEDAPQTYYLTDYYRKYAVVLIRLAHIDEEALREMLSISRRLTLPKVRGPAKAGRHATSRPSGSRSARRARS